MNGLIPQGFIDDLLARVPIAEVVGSRVQLKKSGSSLKACCPFHQEKTPSFHVNAQKNFYHCFGCGANGNAINFLRDHDNLGFTEAVEELARIAGVDVPRDERVQQAFNQQKRFLDALEYASLRYREALSGHPERKKATDYLRKRELSDEVVERFAIGFAPAQRDFLSSRASPEQLKSLLKTRMLSDKYDRPFDLFQNRLMFPIRNVRGQTIAFGGRTLGDDKAKYINSPESDIFHKSSEIYGLYEASRASRQLEKLLVVEGYMDVVALAQFGIDYAVATLGTATNEESLSQLLKRCSQLIFCFDGDNAGIQAARKAMENALPLFQDGMQLQFLLLPEGEDPDTLVRQEGADAFQRRIDQAKPLSEFFFQIYSKGLDLNVAEQRGILKQRAEERIAQVESPVLKSALRRQLNELTFRSSGSWNKDKRRPPEPVKDLVAARVLRDPDTAVCLALYYAPDNAEKYLAALTDANGYARSKAFAAYLFERGISNTQDLYYALATDSSGYRETFQGLFARLELLPSAEIAIEEAEHALARIEQEKKRVLALRATKINKSPSQLTDDEKRALRSISTPADKARED